MKIIIPKHILAYLDSLSESERPLNIYGIVREIEGLIHVLSIGECSYLPLIGHITLSGCLKLGDSKLFGLSEKSVEDLGFYYNHEGQWMRVELCVIDLNDSFKRTPFPRNLMNKLQQSTVVIFGLGSGGSRLAVGLSRSGIEHFRLVDPDTFSIENVSRHECDLTDLLRAKTVAVRERILRVNPRAEAKVYSYDVFEKPSVLEEIFSNADLIIGATDRESIQLKINHECWQRKIPALFGGCYEEARGGEVFFTIPGETSICYECLRGGLRQPERLGAIDYSNAQGPEDYEGEPGLDAAINLITDVAQQYAIALLLRNEKCEMAKLISPERNLLFIGGSLGEGYYLFKRPFHFIQPKLKGPWKECGTCQS